MKKPLTFRGMSQKNVAQWCSLEACVGHDTVYKILFKGYRSNSPAARRVAQWCTANAFPLKAQKPAKQEKDEEALLTEKLRELEARFGVTKDGQQEPST